MLVLGVTLRMLRPVCASLPKLLKIFIPLVLSLITRLAALFVHSLLSFATIFVRFLWPYWRYCLLSTLRDIVQSLLTHDYVVVQPIRNMEPVVVTVRSIILIPMSLERTSFGSIS